MYTKVYFRLRSTISVHKFRSTTTFVNISPPRYSFITCAHGWAKNDERPYFRGKTGKTPRGVDTCFNKWKCGHHRQVCRGRVSPFWDGYSLLQPETSRSEVIPEHHYPYIIINDNMIITSTHLTKTLHPVRFLSPLLQFQCFHYPLLWWWLHRKNYIINYNQSCARLFK